MTQTKRPISSRALAEIVGIALIWLLAIVAVRYSYAHGHHGFRGVVIALFGVWLGRLGFASVRLPLTSRHAFGLTLMAIGSCAFVLGCWIAS